MYRIATNLTPEQREAREAHKAARRAKVRAAAAEKAAALGCKVCRRCKGDGSRESWAAMGSVCARCKGRGYELTAEMKAMYLTIPDQTDADGNLLIVPATRTGALYGEQLDSYHQRVAGFFLSRLAAE